MLIKKVELNHPGKLPTRDTLEACDLELKTWQKLFTRRNTLHSESLDALEKIEDVNETAYNKFAGSDPGNSIVPRLLPGVRCSP